MEIIKNFYLRSIRKFYYLERNVIELNTVDELIKTFGWNQKPILDRPDIYDFDFIEDANQRRIRDAESLAAVMRNSDAKIALEIGTSTGLGTTLMAVNAPDCKVYTINISPEEIAAGKGGKLTTIALKYEMIGSEYKKRNLQNIVQIFANTATWKPEINNIDVVFIDGCHDTKFVFNDTKKILKQCQRGSFILWHDFNPDLVNKFHWIGDVCKGVENLYRSNLIHGRIYHLKDSWVGIYRVE